MDITIQQPILSFRVEYDISTPWRNYYASRKFPWSRSIQLFAADDRQTLPARVRQLFYWIRPKFDFELAGGKTYHFRGADFARTVFTCEGNGERLLLFAHKGLHYSIYQNDLQIAAFSKNRLKIGDGDRFAIRLNHNANVILVICMVLAIDASLYASPVAIQYDIGLTGIERNPRDKTWTPS